MDGLPTAFTHEHAHLIVEWIVQSTTSGQQAQSARLLEAAESIPGYCTLLLELASPGSGLAVGHRQLAVICIRNAIRRHWSEGRMTNAARQAGVVLIEERAVVRQRLLENLMIEKEGKVANQMILAIAKIARAGYPSECPDIFNQLMAAMHQALVSLPEGQLQLQRATSVTYRILQELSTKTIATDKRRFMALSMDLLPQLIPMWDQVFSMVQSGVAGAFTAPKQECVTALRGLEPAIYISKTLIKMISRLLGSASHFFIAAHSGPLLSSLSLHSAALFEHYQAYLGLLATARAGRQRPQSRTGLTLEYVPSDDEDEAGVHGLSQIPGGELWVKLFKRVTETACAVFKHHTLAVACNGGTRAIANIYVSWIVAAAKGDVSPPEEVSQYAVMFLTRLLDAAQMLANDGGGGDIDAVFDQIEEPNKYATPHARDGTTMDVDYRAAAAAELRELHEGMFGPASHDDWLTYCIQGQFHLSQNDLMEFSDDPAAWVLRIEDISQADAGLRGAVESLLLSFVSDETFAVDICTKLINYANSTVNQLIDAINVGNEADMSAAASNIDASHLAVGLSAADAIARGVMSDENFVNWLSNTALPVLCMFGCKDVVSSLCAMEPSLAALPELPDTQHLEFCHPTRSSMAQVICRRMIWTISCCRFLLSDSMRLSFLCFCCNIMENAAYGPAPKMAAALFCNAIIDEWPYGAEPLSSTDAISALARASYAAACDVASRHENQQRVLGIMTSALQRAPPEATVGAANAIFEPLSLLWSGDGGNSSSSVGLGGSQNGGLSFIRRYVLSSLNTLLSSIPFCSDSATDLPTSLWTNCFPLVAHCIDANNPDEIFLCRDGLELWITLIETAPDAVFDAADAYSALPLLVPLAGRSSEHLVHVAAIINAYIIRSTERWHMNVGDRTFVELTASILDNLLSNCSSRSAKAVYSALDNALAVSADCIEQFRACLYKLLISLVKGQALRSAVDEEDAADGEEPFVGVGGQTGPTASEIAMSAQPSKGGDDIPAQSDRELFGYGAATLARAFTANENAFLQVLSAAAQEKAAVLHACKALPSYIEELAAHLPDMFDSVASMALLVWCCDMWLDSFEDVAYTQPDSSESYSASSCHSVFEMLRNKLLALAVLRGANLCVSLHGDVSAKLLHTPQVRDAITANAETNFLHLGSFRMDALTTYVADTLDAWDRLTQSEAGVALATAAGAYIANVADNPWRRRVNVNYAAHASTLRGLSASLFTGLATIHTDDASPLQRAIAAAQELRRGYEIHAADEPEAEDDAEEDSSADPMAELSVVLASRNAGYSSARQRLFETRLEVVTDVRAAVYHYFSALQAVLGPEAWNSVVTDRIPESTIAKLIA